MQLVVDLLVLIVVQLWSPLGEVAVPKVEVDSYLEDLVHFCLLVVEVEQIFWEEEVEQLF